MNLILAAEAQDPGMFGSVGSIIILAAFFGFMYFTMIRPENKRKKKQEEMLKALEVGDEITTIGGIVGIIISIREDELIIETGSDRSKLIIKRWAVQKSNMVEDDKSSEVL